MNLRIAVCFAGMAFLLLVSVSAQAQQLTPAADSLFREAVQLAQDGAYEKAAAKFEASYALDPERGTLLGWAVALERLGRTASALAKFRELLDRATTQEDADRIAAARAGIERVEPEVATLSITLEREHADATVMLDGKLLPRGALGSPLPVDPGTHVVSATLPRERRFEQTVLARSRTSERVEIRFPEGTRADPTPTAVPGTHPRLPQIPPAHGVAPQADRTIGYVVGGVGLAALALGTYAGIQTISSWGKRQDHCPMDRCDAIAVAASEDAHLSAKIANVALGIGIVGVGVGGYLLFIAPEAQPGETRAAHGALPAVISMRGVW